MNKKEMTRKTYDNTAKAMNDKFTKIGARTKDISKALSYIDKDRPKVLELGCAGGREAAEILKITDDYTGIDYSQEFINQCKEKFDKGTFIVADLENYDYPQNVDVVFAFASLLHSDKNALRRVLEKSYNSLDDDGVIFISSKYGKYEEKKVIDKFGERYFYFYSPEEVVKLAPNGFRNVYEEKQTFQGIPWFTLILQKNAS